MCLGCYQAPPRGACQLFLVPQVRVQTAAFYEGAVAMLETCGFDDQEFFAHYRVTPSQIMSARRPESIPVAGGAGQPWLESLAGHAEKCLLDCFEAFQRFERGRMRFEGYFVWAGGTCCHSLGRACCPASCRSSR